ncbi:hypothetical protein B0H14DRAFT_3497760 [Mycena olivaceomarginata]|nr:hypothetical protein B0H14DRAFT_3497760 [Mycena olivaceomarginata]
MNAPQTANGNCCIHCGNQLTVKVAEGGKVPGSSFIRCFNGPIPGKPHYFFRFPPQNRSALPTMNTASSTTPVVASSAQTVALQANPVRRLCPTPGCGSGRIQPHCSRKKCRHHCLKHAGPCGAHTHDKDRKAVATPSVPDLYAGVLDFGSHDDWASNASALLNALEAHQRREDAPRVAMERRLDGLFGVKSPTPERERQEDADLQLAMELSLGQTQPHNSAPGPSRPMPRPSLRLPLAITSAGRLCSLSPSPDFPEFPSMLAPSQAAAPGATSAPAPHPLHITTQLNTDWMETASSQSTFHVKHS